MDTSEQNKPYTQEDRTRERNLLSKILEEDDVRKGEIVSEDFEAFVRDHDDDGFKDAKVAIQFKAFSESPFGQKTLVNNDLEKKVPAILAELGLVEPELATAAGNAPANDKAADGADPVAPSDASAKADGPQAAQAPGREAPSPSVGAEKASELKSEDGKEQAPAESVQPDALMAERQKAFAEGRSAAEAAMQSRGPGPSGGGGGGGGSDMGPIAGTIAGLASAPGALVSGLVRGVGEALRQTIDVGAHAVRAASPAVGAAAKLGATGASSVAKFGAEKAGEAVERHQVRSFANKNEAVNEQLKTFEKAAMSVTDLGPNATQADKMHAFGQLGEARDKLLNGMQSELNAGMTQVKNKNMSLSDLTDLADERKERVTAIMDKALDSDGAKSDPFVQGKLKDVKETTLDKMKELIEKITNMVKNLFKPKGAAPKAP